MKSPGEPWNKIVSDWFQQKTIKVLLIGPFKFARERVNVRRVWRVSGFFPGNVEVLTRPRASIKPGTWNMEHGTFRNMPEHAGTFRNIPEHEKKNIFMKINK